jgi:hypothetical protein
MTACPLRHGPAKLGLLEAALAELKARRNRLIVHGLYARCNSQGCLCVLCRSANSDHLRRWRQSRKTEATASSIQQEEHYEALAIPYRRHGVAGLRRCRAWRGLDRRGRYGYSHERVWVYSLSSDENSDENPNSLRAYPLSSDGNSDENPNLLRAYPLSSDENSDENPNSLWRDYFDGAGYRAVFPMSDSYTDSDSHHKRWGDENSDENSDENFVRVVTGSPYTGSPVPHHECRLSL